MDKGALQYYKGIAPNTPVYNIPTLIIEDYLLDARKIEKQDKTMVGGNCSNWYGGFDSYMVADIYDNKIDIPKMRNTDFHDQLPRLSVLPHVQFHDWIYKLAEDRKLSPEEQKLEKYKGHDMMLDVENAKEYGQYEFLDACREMGIIKDLD